MSRLIYSFVQQLLRRPIIIAGIIFCCLTIGFFIRYSYLKFLYLQAQNISLLSVFNEIIVPLIGLCLFMQIFTASLASAFILPVFSVSGQASLFHLSALSTLNKLKVLFFSIFSFTLIPVLLVLMTVVILSFYSSIDWLRLSVLLTILTIIGCVISLFCVFISSCVKSPVAAVLINFLSLIVFLFIESAIRVYWFEIPWQGLFLPLFTLREGVIFYADVAVYCGWLILFFGLVFYRLSHLSEIVIYPKVICFIGLLLVIGSPVLHGEIDFSREKKNTISSQIIQLVIESGKQIKITAIVDDSGSREEVIKGYELLKTTLPESELKFVSRQALSPELQSAGEFIQFSLGEIQQAVSYPFNQEVKRVFETTILQLVNRKQQWITFVEGHGEASPLGKKSSDMGLLYQVLGEKGWPIAVQNLQTLPVISDNTNLLVIAASKQAWLPKEVDIVIQYLRNGGNMLVLADPESYLPFEIEQFTGVSRIKGTLVDWNAYQSGVPHPAVVIVNQPSEHPVAKSINTLLAFPWSSGLKINPLANEASQAIKREVILKTHKGVWNEFDIEQTDLAFNESSGEQQQSFDLAVAYTDQSKKQRIVLVGDSHFASDTAINNYGNKQLVLNLVGWLTHMTTLENISEFKDHQITPSISGHWLMQWLLSLVAPVIIFLFWWWRRTQRLKSVN